jgi:hypothetical protein
MFWIGLVLKKKYSAKLIAFTVLLQLVSVGVLAKWGDAKLFHYWGAIASVLVAMDFLHSFLFTKPVFMRTGWVDFEKGSAMSYYVLALGLFCLIVYFSVLYGAVFGF